MGEGVEETTKIETMNKNIYMLTKINSIKIIDCLFWLCKINELSFLI